MPEILPFHSPDCLHEIAQAVECVQAGGVLAIPTDSFYALAVGVFDQSALERLVAIKGGRDNNPFPVLIGYPSQLTQLTEDFPDVARTLMKKFWPGLLTLVLQACSPLSPILTGGQGTIGVRQPNDSRVCELLKHTGPLTGTSANRTGQKPAQTAEEVVRQLGADLDVILDGGPTPGGLPSTVLQLKPEVRILREGAVSRSALSHILGNDLIPA